MSNLKLEPLRLEYRVTPGTGKEVYVHLNKNESFIEIRTKNCSAPVIQTQALCRHLGYEPWIQFPSKEWDDLIQSVLSEMVDLWNKNHSISTQSKSP